MGLKLSAIFLRHLYFRAKFYGDRLWGTSSSGALNARGVAKYSDVIRSGISSPDECLVGKSHVSYISPCRALRHGAIVWSATPTTVLLWLRSADAQKLHYNNRLDNLPINRLCCWLEIVILSRSIYDDDDDDDDDDEIAYFTMRWKTSDRVSFVYCTKNTR